MVIIAVIVVLTLLSTTTVAQSEAGCVTENYEYAHDKMAEFCVLRGLQDDGRTAQQERFANVAVLNSRIRQLPARFYARFPQLELLVVRNSTLDRLDINGTVRVIHAEGNKIRSLRVDGTSELRELYLRANPIESIADAVSSLPSLEKLDLSDTAIAKDETLEVNSFAGLNNVQELYLVDVRAYYFENEKNRVLPNLRLLDVSRNTFIPTNFDLRLFHAFPRLEVLNLSHGSMTDLSISNIRGDFPALKQIHLEGNDFKCSLLQPLLDHLKKNNVEPVEPSEPEACKLEYRSIANMCCQEDSLSLPMPTPAVPPKITGAPPTVPTTGPSAGTSGGTKASEPERDGSGSDNGHLIGYIAIALITSALVIASVLIVVIYIKRKSQGMHVVPPNDPKENIEI
ncbi:uncharacterized protein LOC131206099 [Anopheles bellator]|uniref:uncharacterized protein LOC131206099 n=1 Tax=Anopheles bellator TaxID=139047 RepID=UPI002647BAF2|nr:uncharacterized protein LOC131206099 [Anopheles bellator]